MAVRMSRLAAVATWRFILLALAAVATCSEQGAPPGPDEAGTYVPRCRAYVSRGVAGMARRAAVRERADARGGGRREDAAPRLQTPAHLTEPRSPYRCVPSSYTVFLRSRSPRSRSRAG